ncbi:hypothetical protein [Thalassospira alkalitolerans]|uniref:Uncharacterized protein n=1 Tax=Thalassospira alkalitolerans TaxID=1293890 RepID=A0A1Y2LBB6_9PROT|nr:hypothetical protein [Thalassospira alkalitolerans]OSQ47959.1 hypothetical protein TALK_10115 [Thalassospira alkalitolerans]
MMSDNHLLIRIHGMAGGQSACRVIENGKIKFLSPENAGIALGAQWFATILTNLRKAFPTCDIHGTLDCRGRLSSALAAMETGIDAVLIDAGSHDLMAQIESLGAKSGCTVMRDLPATEHVYETGDDYLPAQELDRRLAAFLAR